MPTAISSIGLLLLVATPMAIWGSQRMAARQGDPWRRAAVVSGEIRLNINWVSLAELKAKAREAGQRAVSRPSGYSILRLNVRTGEYRCDIYLIAEPKRLGDRATATLGHELAHCLGYSHE